MDIQIRKAEIKDAVKICGISCNDPGHECDDLLVKNRLKNISPNRETVFVAESGGEVIGSIHAEKYELLYCETMANILGLAVKSEFRRMGAGRKLISAAENRALENGIKIIRINSGISRTGVHEFYRSIGFDSKKDS